MFALDVFRENKDEIFSLLIKELTLDLRQSFIKWRPSSKSRNIEGSGQNEATKVSSFGKMVTKSGDYCFVSFSF